ncbi:MAG: YabP/YqfC family sporulation protein [Clostridia bacterium]|nr:YabP/YqfC family sporulation protein [Clostridia bacterium]
MRLYDELFTGEQSALPRCIITLGGDAYFIGVKTVGDFSPEKIVLHFTGQQVEIAGENLCIRKYCDGDLALRGNVREIKILDKERGK